MSANFEQELTRSTPLTTEDINNLRPIFAFFDSDSDGFLTPEQVRLAYVQLGFRDEQANVITRMDFPQFLLSIGLIKKKGSDHELEWKVRHSYRLLDPGHAKTVTFERLEEFMYSIGHRMPKTHAERLVELMADDVEFKEPEFVKYVMTHLPRTGPGTTGYW